MPSSASNMIKLSIKNVFDKDVQLLSSDKDPPQGLQVRLNVALSSALFKLDTVSTQRAGNHSHTNILSKASRNVVTVTLLFKFSVTDTQTCPSYYSVAAFFHFLRHRFLKNSTWKSVRKVWRVNPSPSPLSRAPLICC